MCSLHIWNTYATVINSLFKVDPHWATNMLWYISHEKHAYCIIAESFSDYTQCPYIIIKSR